jgi:hypothetical protein
MTMESYHSDAAQLPEEKNVGDLGKVAGAASDALQKEFQTSLSAKDGQSGGAGGALNHEREQAGFWRWPRPGFPRPGTGDDVDIKLPKGKEEIDIKTSPGGKVEIDIKPLPGIHCIPSPKGEGINCLPVPGEISITITPLPGFHHDKPGSPDHHDRPYLPGYPEKPVSPDSPKRIVPPEFGPRQPVAL